jgi:hypothetical protein
MEQDGSSADLSGGLNPLAVVLLLLAGLVLLASSRQNGLKAMLGVAMVVPLEQKFVVLGLHFMFFRVMIAVGLARVFLRGEHCGFTLNKMDRLFIVWTVIGVVCGAIRGLQAQHLGFAYDALGVYFLVRVLAKEPEDVLGSLRFLCLLSLVVAAVMCVEATTYHNPFSILGGVPLMDNIRGGRVRCQGPFPTCIEAGVFGACFLPLMIGLWWQGGRGRRAAVAGIIGCAVIAVTAVSSGALMCAMTACLGLCLWRARNRMRLFRRAVVAMLIALAIVMKSPVWYLIAKVSDVVGGGGWHRSYLIDLCVHNFSRWWLVGDAYTKQWAPDYLAILGDPNSLDITNYYVSQCIGGGIWMIAVFLAILTCCFRIVGRLVRSDENLAWKRTFIWTFGVCLAAYCTSFISSGVATQSSVFWYWLLAVVAGLPACVTDSAAAEVSEAEPASEDPTKSPLDGETEPRYSPNPT